MAPLELGVSIRFYLNFCQCLGFENERQYGNALEFDTQEVMARIRAAIKRLEQGKEAA